MAKNEPAVSSPLRAKPRPPEDHRLQWISISYDQALNRRGEFRIDAESAEPVSPGLAVDEPWLWKALSVGTALDIEVIRKIKAKKAPKLGDYWHALDLVSRNGYQIKEHQKQQSSEHLRSQRSAVDLYATAQLPNQCPHAVARRLAAIAWTTRHRRQFTYLQTGEPAPELAVRHLWLAR